MIDHSWRRTYRNDDPQDTLDRKLMQAEALASMLYGQDGEVFRANNPVSQDNIQWLLADLITDAREALDDMYARRGKGKSA